MVTSEMLSAGLRECNDSLSAEQLRRIYLSMRELDRDNHADVAHFHRHFEIAYDGPPRLLTPDLQSFRRRFLEEELFEFEQAWIASDLTGAFDALLDLAYVVHGTAHLMGLPWQPGWAIVQACNMRKVRVASASDSKRGHAWDVKKPPGWIGPESELRRLLEC